MQATGREQAGQQTAALPAPLPIIDDTDLSAYTRTYDYDRGGNLSAIHHQGSQPYTLAMVVSSTSNRTLQQSDGLTPADVDAGFDAAGQLLALAAGQPLGWDTRGQLQTVTLVRHDDGSSDQENYRYDGHGQRSQKTLTTRTSGTTRSQRVRYLPGLELRDTTQTPDGGSASTVETLQLLQLDGSGRLSVRALHWSLGQPADIANDGLRYSLADPVGSSLLELDDAAAVVSWEAYYPYGGTAAWAARSDSEVSYKFVRYSGKERDASGLYAYGLRYYAPWLGRWINPDPGGTIDGLNLFRMVSNNPLTLRDRSGLRGSGYIYVPFLSRDTVDIAIALYTQKYAVNKKPDIVVFSSRNEQLDFYEELKKRRSDFAAAMGKSLFEKYNTSDLSRKSLLNAGVKETEIKSTIMSIGNYLAINSMTLMNQQDDEIFSEISIGDKLKIIGHGSAGSAEISSGGLKSVTLSMHELAERLDFSGLPDQALQITLLPCQSGDELLEPVFIEGKSPFMRTRPSAAESLFYEMQARGYRRVTTAGYRGFGQIRGFLESTGSHHTQRKPNSITASDDIVRRRDAKEIFC